MRLINKQTGKEVYAGDTIQDPDGNDVMVINCSKPHKPASSGKIVVSGVDNQAYERYVSVFGLEWIEREDRGWVHPEVELKRIIDIYKDMTNVDMSGWNLQDVIDTVRSVEIAAVPDAENCDFMYKWLHKQ